MSTKVLLKKSSVLGKVPLATDLSYGELALNYADGKLYFKDSANSIKSFNSSIQLSINDLSDVDTSTTTPNIGQVLKWNGTNWVPGNDETVGGTGTDADTLDGFDSSYFLNYNNLSNKPTLFSGDYNDLTNKPLLFNGDYNNLINKPFVPSKTGDLTNDAGFITASSLTGLATETYVNTAISNLIDGAPSALDTLNELAAALGDDSNFATTISTQLASKVDSSSLATVATSGSYDDLTNKPTLFSGAYADLTGKPTLFSGAYADLTGKPFIPTKTSDITNDSGYLIALDLIGYATESYVTTSLSDKQNTLVSGTNIKTINGQSLLGSGDIVITGGITSESDPVYATSSWYTTTNNASNWDTAYGWGNHASAGYLTTSSSIDWSQIVNEPTLFSGDYNDLTNKPTIPTVPTLVSAFTNDANYVNTTQLATKQDELVSGTSIKTINGESILGSGNITISGSGTGASALSELTDVSIPSPTDGQSLVYNSSLSKWTAQDVSSGLYTNTASTTTTAANQVVDSFAKTLYRTVKYIIQATSASEVHSVEVSVMHNDVNVFTTVYNVMYSGAGKLFEVGSTVNGLNIDLTVTPLVEGLTVDVTRIGLVSRSIGIPLPTDLELESFPLIDLETQTYPTKDLN